MLFLFKTITVFFSLYSMKIVDPNNTNHNITFRSRYETTTALNLILTNEANKEFTDVTIITKTVSNGNVTLNFDFDFTEADRYQIKITDVSGVYYRGLLFATDQETQDYKVYKDVLTY